VYWNSQDQRKEGCIEANQVTETCGKSQVFGAQCQQHGASCTPFAFMPNVDNKDCSWVNAGHFDSAPFFADKNAFGYQGFRAWDPAAKTWKAEDIWVAHGCDGSGIQTDCRGDVFYLEHFMKKTPVGKKNCFVGSFGKDHVQCPTMYVPGLDKSFEGPGCGWWRGFNFAAGIEFASDKGVGAMGPAGAGGDYRSQMKAALSNVYQQGVFQAGYNGLQHPYGGKPNTLAYFVGAVWNWVCNHDLQAKVGPYTTSDANCYCDNEPWNGRGKGEREYPRNSVIAYCGLYDDAGDRFMVCDFLTTKDPAQEPSGNNKPWSEVIRGETLRMDSWP